MWLYEPQQCKEQSCCFGFFFFGGKWTKTRHPTWLTVRETDSPSDAEVAVQSDATRATTSSCCMSEPACVYVRACVCKELSTTTCYLPVFLQGVSYLSITAGEQAEWPRPLWPSPLIELR